MPKSSSHVSKRQIELTAEERSLERPSKKRREDLGDSVVKAFAADGALSGLLNVAVHEHGSPDCDNISPAPDSSIASTGSSSVTSSASSGSQSWKTS